MTDNRMTDRVKVMLNGMPTPDIAGAEPPMAAPEANMPNQALHVLTLAQRTADEHVRTAHRHAEKIRADAMAAAEQIARDADAHAEKLRREADKVLAEARAAAERIEREAQARAAEAQRNADVIVAKARTQEETIVAHAERNAEELKQQAQRRYDDVVGSLATKREALQEQIEALERFDREYRARLTAFMQGQLRALWADQPQVTGALDEADPDDAESEAPEPPVVEQRAAEAVKAAVPVQRQQTPEPVAKAAHALSDN